MNEWMNDEAVCRRALDTLGLFKNFKTNMRLTITYGGYISLGGGISQRRICFPMHLSSSVPFFQKMK